MTAPTVTREEIERLDRDLIDRISHGAYRDAPAPIDMATYERVVRHLAAEPARIAAAQEAGWAEGKEWARGMFASTIEATITVARAEGAEAMREAAENAAFGAAYSDDPETHTEQICDAIRALPLPDAPVAEPGRKMIPREPDKAMLEAAFGPIMDGGRGGPITSDRIRQMAAVSTFQKIWDAAPVAEPIAPVPQPAEPTVPAAALVRLREELDALRDATAVWKEDHVTMENLRGRFLWLDDHDTEVGPSEFKVIEAHIAALEAENAKLRERLTALVGHYVPAIPYPRMWGRQREEMVRQTRELLGRGDENRAAAPQPASVADDENATYEIGKRDGYEEAVQEIDVLTGGDGEYVYSTLPGEGCPDPAAMIERIGERFEALSQPAPPVPAAEIVEVLQFYRGGFAYHPRRSKTGINLSEWKPKDALLDDCGERARALLDRLEVSRGE